MVTKTTTALHGGSSSSSNDYSNTGGGSSKIDFNLLQERVDAMRVRANKDWLQRPQHNGQALSPQDFCSAVLQALQHNDDPWPDAGLETLWQCSTHRWRQYIAQSVGAPLHADMATVVPVLSTALTQDNNKNQFSVLLSQDYVWDFPTETVDFLKDSSCWVECRLHNRANDDTSGSDVGALLVITGWSLSRTTGEGWRLDDLEWQDFRDDFRPGVGREEWERICG